MASVSAGECATGGRHLLAVAAAGRCLLYSASFAHSGAEGGGCAASLRPLGDVDAGELTVPETASGADQLNDRPATVQCVAVDAGRNLLAVSTSRRLLCVRRIDAGCTQEQLLLPKAAARLLFDRRWLLVADRFGNVVRYPLHAVLGGGERAGASGSDDDGPGLTVDEEEVGRIDGGGQFLLGHVSALTDALLLPATRTCPRLLLTADRDEKIRASHYPRTYDIAAYWLAHEAHVAGLAALSAGYVASVGGDNCIKLWRSDSGECRLTVQLDSGKCAKKIVAAALPAAGSSLLVCSFHRSPHVAVYSVSVREDAAASGVTCEPLVEHGVDLAHCDYVHDVCLTGDLRLYALLKADGGQLRVFHWGGSRFAQLTLADFDPMPLASCLADVADDAAPSMRHKSVKEYHSREKYERSKVMRMAKEK